ncbi:MAG: 16S rRNA (guanine(527)-N(7))-methyltransferase RsmG [Pseudomonadota bacterium]
MLKIEATALQIRKMTQYAEELMAWNKKINLTAIKDPLQVAEKHFIDSIAVMSLLENDHQMMDMGSGGGFPGIVIKIMNPSIRVVLVDSVRKKINFLKHVIRLLDLNGIDAVHSRVEDLNFDDQYARQFDGVISRAFADLSKYIDLAHPFIKPGGSLYAMKGRQGLEEVTSDMQEKYTIITKHYQLPFEKSERYVIKLTPLP